VPGDHHPHEDHDATAEEAKRRASFAARSHSTPAPRMGSVRREHVEGERAQEIAAPYCTIFRVFVHYA